MKFPKGTPTAWGWEALAEEDIPAEIARIAGLAVVTLSPSESLRNSNDSLKDITETEWTKKKQCLLNADLPACRIKFTLYASRGNAAPAAAYGQIYKNGVPIGNSRSGSTMSSEYWTFSEDFSGFVSGDLIQIYCKKSGSGTHRIKDMRFYYGRCFTELLGEVIQTPADFEMVTAPISITNQA